MIHDPVLDIREHYRSVELSKMRLAMNYGIKEYRQDWELSVALAILLAAGHTNKLELMLDSCFMRIHAYLANNPGVMPFDIPSETV